MAPGNMALESLNTVLGTVFMIWSKRTASSFFGGGSQPIDAQGSLLAKHSEITPGLGGTIWDAWGSNRGPSLADTLPLALPHRPHISFGLFKHSL